MQRASRGALYLATLVVVLGLGKAHAAFLGHYVFHGSSRFAWSLAYVGLLALAAYSAGLPELAVNGCWALLPSLASTLAAATAISLAQLAMGSQLLPRFVVLWSILFLTPVYTLCAFVADDGRKRVLQADRVLAVVELEEGGALVAELQARPERPATLVETVDPAAMRPRRLGQQPLVELAQRAGATVVVLDRAAQADHLIVEQAAVLHARGARVRTLSLFYEEWLGKLPMPDLERTAMMFDIGEVHRARYGRLKRLLDVAIGLLGLVPLLGAASLVALGNLAANPGPLFYRQTRVGKGGREFTILKFRTMRPSAGASTWTTDRDPRVSPLGHWLRRFHIDELPQVINILRGDLAVVGPRPEQPCYVDELARKLPFYELRHLVRPGLTGWAQVKYGYGGSDLDALEKLQYELYYLRHQSLALDLRVMGRTARAVVGRGAR